MRTAHIVSVLASCFLVTACGKTAAPPQTPPASQVTPARVERKDPPPAEKTLVSTVPPGWVRVADEDALIYPKKNGGISFQAFRTNGKNPKDVLTSSLAEIVDLTPSKIETTPDGLRAWVTLTGTTGAEIERGKLMFRRIPKTPDTPEDVTVACFGGWPASEDVPFTKDFDAYIESFRYR